MHASIVEPSSFRAKICAIYIGILPQEGRILFLRAFSSRSLSFRVVLSLVFQYPLDLHNNFVLPRGRELRRARY